MTDYYDGPRKGIAHFRGQPHLYESEWKDIDGDSGSDDSFLLTPLPQDAVEAALEDWAIWLRWEEAFHQGRTGQETHPALPEDRIRHEALAETLRAALATRPGSAVRARAEFRNRPDSTKQFGWRELEVRWTVLEDVPDGQRAPRGGPGR
jgi:hypothetical protein